MDKRSKSSWATFHHGADIGIRGIGPSLNAAFEQGGLALTGVMTEPERIKSVIQRKITCNAPSTDLLFYPPYREKTSSFRERMRAIKKMLY
jgi:SHS2 domain-containing protein